MKTCISSFTLEKLTALVKEMGQPAFRAKQIFHWLHQRQAEAFEQMTWNEDDLSILLEQRKNIVEVPEIPGGYYLTRAVDQAYWQVINKTKNVKDALVYWSDVADNEIARKIKQYS